MDIEIKKLSPDLAPDYFDADPHEDVPCYAPVEKRK